MHSEMGNPQRAIEDFDEAIRLNPTYANAYFNKGVALANNGQPQESLPLFEKAHELGHQGALGAIQQVRGALGLPPMQVQANPNDPQAAFEAFQGAASPDAMQQVVAQFLVLRQMIPTIEQVIQTQVPPEARPAFEQRLAWLQQIVGDGGASAPDEQQQAEEAVQQLVGLYQQHGEAGLRQVLGQQGVPADQIEQIVTVVKQALGEG